MSHMTPPSAAAAVPNSPLLFSASGVARRVRGRAREEDCVEGPDIYMLTHTHT